MAEENKEQELHNQAPANTDSKPSVGGNEAVDNHMEQMAGGDAGVNNKASNDPAAHQEKAEIDYGLSAVAKNPKQNMITIVIFVVVICGLAYYFFFSGSKETKKHDPASVDAQKIVDSNPSDIPIPSIPDSTPASAPAPAEPAPKSSPEPAQPKTPKKETAAPPPPAPAATPPQAGVSPFDHAQMEERMRLKQEAAKRKEQKIKANIMVQNGGGKSDASKKKQDLLATNGIFTPEKTSATQTQITKMGKMSSVIAQGKIMDAVLESSIISNYPGPIRALITRDVYSEKGDNVLIQKGSRIIGTFSSGFSAGQNRITITWNRIIMPNGYDIAVESKSIGPEGIVGVEGKVHTEMAQTLTNALLVSAINVAFTKGAQDLTNTKPNLTSQTSNGTTGDTTTTSVNDPTRDAIQQATQNFNQTMQQYVQQNFMVKPFISIPHGTRVKVFVNKDLLFPKNIADGVNIVQ